MRLWSYQLLPCLPNKMLVSQWRECVAIMRQWKKGSLKHRLVSYVMNYDKDYFLSYVFKVVSELVNRGINFNGKIYNEIRDFCWQGQSYDELIYYPEHNERYLKQCYYNLQEKYDRGIIRDEEWEKIEKTYWEVKRDDYS